MARARGSKSGKLPALVLQIRALRVRLGDSQGAFARRIGVTQQTVSDWERGKRLRQIQVAQRLLTLLATRGASSGSG